jgi:hypothetical protein
LIFCCSIETAIAIEILGILLCGDLACLAFLKNLLHWALNLKKLCFAGELSYTRSIVIFLSNLTSTAQGSVRKYQCMISYLRGFQ